jgi:hypothetical protein
LKPQASIARTSLAITAPNARHSTKLVSILVFYCLFFR